MANIKIGQLTEATTAGTTDYLVIVDQTGTSETKKIEVQNFLGSGVTTISGTTFLTSPSGVTIDFKGINSTYGTISGTTFLTSPSGVTINRTTVSGVTMITNPSGVTIDFKGINSAYGYHISYPTIGYQIETGTGDGHTLSYRASGDPSSTLSINFSNITTGVAFNPSVKADAVTSTVSNATWKWSTNDTAGVSVFCHSATGAAAQCLNGSSITWTAIGT